MLSYPDFKEKHIIIVFTNKGEKYSFLNDNIIVKDTDDKIILQTSCYKTLALWIVGGGQISTGLLERSKKFGFPIAILSYAFKPVGIWNAATEGNFLLRNKQYKYESLDIARYLVQNKMINQIKTLKSIRGKTVECAESIKKIVVHHHDLGKAFDLQTILGLEGIAAKTYFRQWFSDCNWQGRKPRAKIDITNVLLDMGYTFLFYFIENMLNLYGFDLYKGVYHTNFYSRKSLVCDLQEPFRCIIDRQIKKSFNLGQIHTEDFSLRQGRWTLEYKHSKDYTQFLLKALLEYKADIFLYCQKYYRAFIREKEIDEFPVFDINKPTLSK